ncbi:MAG: FKBP-type peptidyl-prolyl cis-trans isomerase [bacterium]
MKKFSVLLVAAVVMFSFFSCQQLQKDGEKPVVKEDIQEGLNKKSYALGVDIATNFKSRHVELDMRTFTAGFKAGLEGNSLMNDEEKMTALNELQQDMMKKMQEEASKKAEENKAKGAKFLEENKEKEGVIVTDSGLQYVVEQEGKGPKPAAEDTVEVHYTGTLLDGTEFDSSVRRGQPVEFPLNGVIKGWTEGLQLMSVGAKFKFFIPSDLAYGDFGNQGIGPGETLIFEVELLSIKKAGSK